MDLLILNRFLYRGGRPRWLARVMNRGWAAIHSLGILPDYMVTLQVIGRRTGKKISFPVALARVDGREYLVSMLGAKSTWVANVQAAGGHAVIIHRGEENVLLTEVPVEERPRILKEYLRIAPAARPHMHVKWKGSLEDFETVAGQFPVFRVLRMNDANLTRQEGMGDD